MGGIRRLALDSITTLTSPEETDAVDGAALHSWAAAGILNEQRGAT
jgi:hypothetical protein